MPGAGRTDPVTTPDGCPVEVYARMPAGRLPDALDGVLPRGASVLDLGAGAGRITRPLAALGHHPVAVDESAEMLRHAVGVHTVHGRIEDLWLGRTFDAVLLLSHLVEKPDRDTVRAFLRTCRRHVRADGCVIVQRDPPGSDYLTDPPVGREINGGVLLTVRDVAETEPGTLRFTIDYTIDGRTWSQDVINRHIDDDTLRAELARAGLALDGFLNASRSLALARPVPGEG